MLVTCATFEIFYLSIQINLPGFLWMDGKVGEEMPSI